MAFPTLLEVVSTIALLAACVGIVDLLSSRLRLHPQAPTISDSRKEASMVAIVLAAVFVVTSVMESFRYDIYRPMFHLDERPPLTVDHYDLLFTGFFYVPWFVILFLAMRKTGQSRDKIGLTKDEWKRTLVLALILSVSYFVIVGLFSSLFSSGFASSAASLLFGFMVNAVVGLSEELVWRGYVQTRLVAYGGAPKGLLVTSVLFAVLHFPQRYFLYSGAALEALSSALLVTAAGLLFGYVMLKTQNVIAPSVFHLFANWTSQFWGIGSF